MLNNLKTWYHRKNLKDSNFSFLFDAPPGNEVVCFDCETTGLNPEKAELLSIAALIIRGNRILTSKRLELFVKPTSSIDENSIKIHHLRHCDVKNGLDSTEAITEFLNFIGSRPLVGYYLEFDVAMINKYLKSMIGIPLPNKQIEISGIYYDKKQKVIPQGHIDLRFDSILADLKLPKLSKHDAFNDALMTAMIYVKLQHTRKLT
jgi:DNA polymerase-3 subunit epsilon